MPKIPSEHAEQVTFLAEFRKAWPGVRIFAIPNGGWRSKTEVDKLKAEGIEPGVPDLYIPEWKLWVEMKRTKDYKVSDEQKDWHEYLERECGDRVVVGIGWEDAMMKVKGLPS